MTQAVSVAYVSTTQVRAAMPNVDLSSAADAILNTLIIRASRMIDDQRGHQPGAFKVTATTIKYYDGNGGAVLLVDEIATSGSLAVAMSLSGGVSASSYTALAATDYLLEPYNAWEEGIPYTRLELDDLNGSYVGWYRYRRAVKVTAYHGFSVSVPYPIEQATITQVVRWYKRGQQAFQDAGAITELGQLKYVAELDPDIKAILAAPRFARVTV